jgi:D-2-hydroxyacid dehydrogenase (NADP+)
MATILIRHPLTLEEMLFLRSEFPRFTHRLDIVDQPLSDAEWADVQVLYGDRLSAEEWKKATSLQWLHVPHTSLNSVHPLALQALVVTISKNPDTHQAAEYALGALLGFSKNLFNWQGSRDLALTSHLRDLTWSLRHRRHLQIGLGSMGNAIAAKCRDFGMRVWGVADPPSFNAYCQKVFPRQELHSLLPACDAVCVSMRMGQCQTPVLGREELELMRQDAILLVLGSAGLVDEEALAHAALSGKFRGVALDLPLHGSRVDLAQLAGAPQVLLTSQIAELPVTEERFGYRLFLHNLRRFSHRDLSRMVGLLARSAVPEPRLEGSGSAG